MTRTLLRVTTLASLLSVASCAGGGTPSGTSTTGAAATSNAEEVKKTIAGLEQEWAKAIVAKDAAAVGRLLADDFKGTSENVLYSKADAIGDVRGDTTYDALELTNIDVRVFGDTAIATMDQTERGKHGGEAFSGHYLFTNVWVKRNGQWQAVSSHGSRGR
jgi:ketosteroid isomerase-like protein